MAQLISLYTPNGVFSLTLGKSVAAHLIKVLFQMDIVLIGTGFRSRTVYRLLFPALRARGVRLVAVYDPVR